MIKWLKEIYEKIRIDIYVWYVDIIERHYIKQCKKKYPDYVDDEYNMGELKFIWGIKSWDDLSGKAANIHTMNDIEIDYNRETKQYMLGIETAYTFKNKQGECDYIQECLNAFTKFMDDNNYNKNESHSLFMSDTVITNKANSIPELYTQFRIFAEGLKAINKGE